MKFTEMEKNWGNFTIFTLIWLKFLCITSV